MCICSWLFLDVRSLFVALLLDEMEQFPLNNLTHGSRACAYFLYSTDPGNDVDIILLISIHATLYLP